MKRIKEELKKLWEIFQNPLIRVLPGQIAFFLFLAIFPILILIGVIASFFSVSMSSVVTIITETFPKDVVDLLVPLLDGKGFDTHVGVSMITAYILASNGAHSIVVASNTLYGFPHSEWLKRRIKSLFMIFLMIGLFIFTIIVLAFGDVILKASLSALGINLATSLFYHIILYARWPVSLLIMYFNIKLIYAMAPDWKILSKYTTKGAIFTTIGWMLATAIYSYYINHFSHYDLFYGSLSNIVILMIWIYALSYILVIGIAINVNEYQNVDRE